MSLEIYESALQNSHLWISWIPYPEQQEVRSDAVQFILCSWCIQSGCNSTVGVM